MASTTKARLHLLEKVVDPKTVNTWSPVPEKDIERRIMNLERAVFGRVDPTQDQIREKFKCTFCARWVVYRYVQTDTNDSPEIGPHICRSCVREWKEELGENAGEWELWDSGRVIGPKELEKPCVR